MTQTLLSATLIHINASIMSVCGTCLSTRTFVLRTNRVLQVIVIYNRLTVPCHEGKRENYMCIVLKLMSF